MGTKSKKAAYAAAAIVLSSLLLLGGTLAWQSISQRAVNKVSDEVNPGGRLHDDFDGVNKDIYVENFADESIFARVRLLEYLEIGDAAGINTELADGARYDELGNVAIELEGTPVTARVITPGAKAEDKSTWPVHLYDRLNLTDVYIQWEMGGSTVYMPTFNMNKDSLEADVNGTLIGENGLYPWQETETDIVDAYLDNVLYGEGAEVYAYEIHDADVNTVDEIQLNGLSAYDYLTGDPNGDLAEYIAGGNVEMSRDVARHTAKRTANASLISVKDWLTLYDKALEETGNPKDALDSLACFWAYDDDGWCYYTGPIPAGEATGLLLSGVTATIDDNYYYAIHVESQLITAGDIGDSNSTGFYTDPAKAPSDNALKLLGHIGVTVPQGS